MNMGFDATIIGVATLFLGVNLTLLARVDAATGRLPDRYTFPLIAAGLAVNAALAGGWPLPAIAGSVLGYAVFWALGSLFFVWRGTEGLGLGDAKLLAAAGAWVGFSALPWVVLLAALGALAVAFARGVRRTTEIPFGPYLCVAILVVWLARIPLL